MSPLLRLLIVYLVAGLLLGWGLRALLRRLAPARAQLLLLAIALAPFGLHALDTALRVAPRGGAGAAAGYGVAALALAAAGGLLGWRWRASARIALLPLALAAAALPASWILGAAMRRAGETTDAIPLIVYLVASLVAAVALAVARLRLPARRATPARRGEAADDATGRERSSGARIAGRIVSALLRRLRR